MITLRIVAALYLLSGLWCLVQPELAAQYIGYQSLSPVVIAEFFTVYGGIQLGLGLAMMLGSLNKNYQQATLFFALVFSVVLLLSRLASFISYPAAVDHMGALMMAELEAFLAIALGIAYYRAEHRQQGLRSSMI